MHKSHSLLLVLSSYSLSSTLFVFSPPVFAIPLFGLCLFSSQPLTTSALAAALDVTVSKDVTNRSPRVCVRVRVRACVHVRARAVLNVQGSKHGRFCSSQVGH